jgi:hypothetical protein
LVLGILMYQNRFRGFPPPYIKGGNPGGSHRLHDGTNVSTRNSFEGWSSLGMLYGTGIIVKTPAPTDPAPVMFFCPVQFNPLLRYPDGWNSTIKRGGYSYRLSLNLDPAYGSVDAKPFVVKGTKPWQDYVSATKGRFRTVMAITSDVICADALLGGNDILVWSHDRPPFVCAGFSDGHAEAVRVPDNVYKLSNQKLGPSLGRSDLMCMGIFSACDSKDFKTLELWLKTLP